MCFLDINNQVSFFFLKYTNNSDKQNKQHEKKSKRIIRDECASQWNEQIVDDNH